MFDGRVQIYRRPGGQHWQCAARVGGKRFSAINRGVVQTYRVKRSEETIAATKREARDGKPSVSAAASQQQIAN